jgi:galactokinase
MNPDLLASLRRRHATRFGRTPSVTAFAPGRIEVLGNHTDYNEGLVLSAATDMGVAFCASLALEPRGTVQALDVHEEATLPIPLPAPATVPLWARYVLGVAAVLEARGLKLGGFEASFSGDLPLGAGLSSSAALEVSTALALSGLFGLTLPPLELAKACQEAENRYTGARCGLLDQVSSLFGREHALVLSDFRDLSISTAPMPAEACFLVADTGVKHSLVEGEYNERRACCEEAARFFAGRLPHPVRALRDVSLAEWTEFAPGLPDAAARRARHVIGENERVRRGADLLARGDLRAFGRLMFESHESSRTQFENSCPELDAIVETAHTIPAVYGARLSGGGFGGSALLLVPQAQADSVAKAVSAAYADRYGRPCACRVIRPSAGAVRV